MGHHGGTLKKKCTCKWNINFRNTCKSNCHSYEFRCWQVWLSDQPVLTSHLQNYLISEALPRIPQYSLKNINELSESPVRVCTCIVELHSKTRLEGWRKKGYSWSRCSTEKSSVFTLSYRSTADTTTAITTAFLISLTVTIWAALTRTNTNMVDVYCWAVTWLGWRTKRII